MLLCDTLEGGKDANNNNKKRRKERKRKKKLVAVTQHTEQSHRGVQHDTLAG